MKFNQADIARIEKELRYAKHNDSYEHTLQKYTGPGTGLVWDDVTDTVSIASGWTVDENGDIVPKA